MAWTADLSGVIPPATVAQSQLRVVLPGGLAVTAIPQGVSPSPLRQAQALLGTVDTALAPLAPFFSLLGTVLAVKEFAEAVPGLLTGGVDKLVKALEKLVKNADALLATVPALSVPVTVAGVLDVLVQLLGGVAAELSALAEQEARIAQARAAVELAPALSALIPQAEAQLAGYREGVAAALGAAEPLVSLLNELGKLAGLEPVVLGVDAAAGTTAEAAAALAAAASSLQSVRNLLPV